MNKIYLDILLLNTSITKLDLLRIFYSKGRDINKYSMGTNPESNSLCLESHVYLENYECFYLCGYKLFFFSLTKNFDLFYLCGDKGILLNLYLRASMEINKLQEH